MRQEWSDAMGAQVFGLLVSLLRPVARRRRPADSFVASDRVELPPQRTEIRVAQNGRRVTSDVQIWLTIPISEPLALAWTLPLPGRAGVESLELQCPGGREPAGLCERREAREWFDLARRAGLPGALLAEDAPGVFGLEVDTPGCGALCVRLRSAWETEIEEDAELVLRCEAEATELKRHGGRQRLVRLGASRRLDSLVGIATAPSSARLAQESVRWSPPTPVDEGEVPSTAALGSGRPDVFAACDRGEGAAAMYRGSLGGRTARLWAEITPRVAAAAAAGPSLPAAAEIERLMAAYRSAERSDAERRGLASEVARLGLAAGLATLWTSFVAVVGSRDPGGELVFAAA